ncbi:MAG: serine/threonine protein kinase [Phycisphaerales bacterium]
MSPRAHREDDLGFDGAKRLLGALRDARPDVASPGVARAEPPDPGSDGVPDHAFPRIPGYRFVARVGSGGAGTVFKVFRDGSDRPLALKLLAHGAAGASDPGGGDAARRAWRELDALESLRLPCVPRLIDYGTHEGRLYFATDFVEGTSLSDFAAPDAASVGPRVELLARVADAVALLHDRAVLHRDLKPSNVIADRSGLPVIIDLGLAHALGTHQATLTQTGVPLGTPAFMAPEAARGEHRTLSIRTDVFGVGAIGYWLLTGEPPHRPDASLHGAIRRAAEEPVRNPLDAAPHLPPPLAAILQKACASRIDHRYATAGDLAADLRRWLRGEPVLAQPPSLWQHALRWAARHPLAATLAACVLIVALSLGGTGAGMWWVLGTPARARTSPDGHMAQLVSRGGNVLGVHGPVDVVLLNQLVQRPAALGSGSVWLLAFRTGGPAEISANVPRNELVAIDPSSPDRTLWSSGDTPLHAPASDEQHPDRYRISLATVADVFPDLPGDEIIATFRHESMGRTAIRVLDLAGTVVYEAWHSGDITGIGWLPSPSTPLPLGGAGGGHAAIPGTLIVSAIGNHLAQSQTDPDGAVHSGYPPVVFALRPAAGQRCGWINLPDKGGRTRADVAWYKRLMPVDLAWRFAGAKVLHLKTNSHMGAAVRLRWDANSNLWPGTERLPQGVGYELLINAAGEPVGSGVPDDPLTTHSAMPVPVDGLTLADAPR